MSKKLITVLAVLLGILTAYTAISFYHKIYGKNVIHSGFIYISSDESMESLSKKLEDFVESTEDFRWVANKKSYLKPRAGKFEILEGMSNNDLINHLRSGKQTPVNVVFNNQDTLEKLAGRVSGQIEADSLEILNAITDVVFLKKQNISRKEALGLFIPNTYEFFWNTTGKGFRERMVKEYERFWNSERKEKAKALNLSPTEVMTLASIVQKETSKVEERPRVAGLYLNRLKKGWPLQADPTVIYAIKEEKGQDAVVKRVLYKDLKIDSPYNTYKYKGLPPSLIGMPDISSIQGVLNAEKHNYFYMCVDVDRLGYHAFAESKYEHNRNARKYQNWLNQQGVYR